MLGADGHLADIKLKPAKKWFKQVKKAWYGLLDDLRWGFDTPAPGIKDCCYRRVGIPRAFRMYMRDLDTEGLDSIVTEHGNSHDILGMLTGASNQENGVGQGTVEGPPVWVMVMDCVAMAAEAAVDRYEIEDGCGDRVRVGNEIFVDDSGIQASTREGWESAVHLTGLMLFFLGCYRNHSKTIVSMLEWIRVGALEHRMGAGCDGEEREELLQEVGRLPGGSATWAEWKRGGSRLVDVAETSWRPSIEDWTWRWEQEDGVWRCSLTVMRESVRITSPTEPVRHLGLTSPVLNDAGVAQAKILMDNVRSSRLRYVMSRVPPSAVVYTATAVPKAKVIYPMKPPSPTPQTVWALEKEIKAAVCAKRQMANTTPTPIVHGHTELGGMGWNAWLPAINAEKLKDFLCLLLEGTPSEKALMRNVVWRAHQWAATTRPFFECDLEGRMEDHVQGPAYVGGLYEYLYGAGYQLRLCFGHRIPRVGDGTIVDALEQRGVGKQSMHLYRKLLRGLELVWVSDLVRGDGMTVLRVWADLAAEGDSPAWAVATDDSRCREDAEGDGGNEVERMRKGEGITLGAVLQYLTPRYPRSTDKVLTSGLGGRLLRFHCVARLGDTVAYVAVVSRSDGMTSGRVQLGRVIDVDGGVTVARLSWKRRESLAEGDERVEWHEAPSVVLARVGSTSRVTAVGALPMTKLDAEWRWCTEEQEMVGAIYDEWDSVVAALREDGEIAETGDRAWASVRTDAWIPEAETGERHKQEAALTFRYGAHHDPRFYLDATDDAVAAESDLGEDGESDDEIVCHGIDGDGTAMECLDCGEPGACVRCRDCNSCGMGGGCIRCKTSGRECDECGACEECGACWKCSGCDLCLDRRGRAEVEQGVETGSEEASMKTGRSAVGLGGGRGCADCGACSACAVPSCCGGVVTSARCGACGERAGCCATAPPTGALDETAADVAAAFKELYDRVPGDEARRADASEDAGGLETTLTAALSVSCGDLVRRHCTRVTTRGVGAPRTAAAPRLKKETYSDGSVLEGNGLGTSSTVVTGLDSEQTESGVRLIVAGVGGKLASQRVEALGVLLGLLEANCMGWDLEHRLDNTGVIKIWDRLSRMTLRQWLRLKDRDVWRWILANYNGQRGQGGTTELMWERGHSDAGGKDHSKLTRHQRGNIKSDAECAAAYADGLLPVGTLRPTEDAGFVLLYHEHGSLSPPALREVVGDVTKHICETASKRVLADYMTAKWGEEYTYETEPHLAKAGQGGRSEVGEAAGRQHILFCKYLWGHLCCEHVRARRAGADGEVVICSLCGQPIKNNWHLFSDCTRAEMVAARKKWVEALQAKLRSGIYVRKNGKKTARAYRVPTEIVALFDLEPDGTMPSWPEYRSGPGATGGTLSDTVASAGVGDVIHVVRWEVGEEEGEDEDSSRGNSVLATLRSDNLWEVGQEAVTVAEFQQQIANGRISLQVGMEQEATPQQSLEMLLDETRRRGKPDLMKGRFRKSTVARVSRVTGATPADTLAFMRELTVVNAREGWTKVWAVYNELTHSEEQQQTAQSRKWEDLLQRYSNMRSGAEEARNREGERLPSTDELERQGMSRKQLSVLIESWKTVVAKYKARLQGIQKYYEAEVGASRGRADVREGGGSDALPPKKRTRQKDIREFGRPTVEEKADAGASRHDAADGPMDCEVAERKEGDVQTGARGDVTTTAGHEEGRSRRRRRTVHVSDSDDDEGAERPGKWGRSRETAAHDETAGTVHGRGEGEMGGDAGARRLGNDSSGRSRSRSRSRDRPESGNVAARERSRSEDAPEPDAGKKRETAGPGLRKGDPKDRGPG